MEVEEGLKPFPRFNKWIVRFEWPTLKKMYVFFLRMYVGLEIDQEVGGGLKYMHKVPKTEYFGPNKVEWGLSQFFKKHVLFFLGMYVFSF